MRLVTGAAALSAVLPGGIASARCAGELDITVQNNGTIELNGVATPQSGLADAIHSRGAEVTSVFLYSAPRSSYAAADPQQVAFNAVEERLVADQIRYRYASSSDFSTVFDPHGIVHLRTDICSSNSEKRRAS